jgi:hypothetical protein
MILMPNDTRQLSAAEREQQRVAYIAAVDEMARTLAVTVKVLNETTKQVDGLLAWREEAARYFVEHSDAIASLERAAAVANTRTAWQRLRALVGL